MSVSESRRIEAIHHLNLPLTVKDFLGALDAPAGMRDLFNCPYYFYSQGAPDYPGNWEDLAHRTLLPLWEHGELVFAVDIALNEPEYISFYLERPSEVTSYGSSIYRALFEMINLHVWEYGGEETEVLEAKHFAARLEFPNLAHLLEMISNVDTSQEEIDAYLSDSAVLPFG
ncbi:hypothetical protein ACN9MY_22055 [Pseudoduganella sp. R-31]|uniref:hypothetical protein n=1 Tax=Pseudoduganella sp. R-31 TaxID=3404060 RepID=UPI003CE92978